MFRYKAFNTFVDDAFAWIIEVSIEFCFISVWLIIYTLDAHSAQTCNSTGRSCVFRLSLSEVYPSHDFATSIYSGRLCRWLYPVDKTRPNEFGYAYEKKDGNEPTKKVVGQEASDSKDKTRQEKVNLQETIPDAASDVTLKDFGLRNRKKASSGWLFHVGGGGHCWENETFVLVSRVYFVGFIPHSRQQSCCATCYPMFHCFWTLAQRAGLCSPNNRWSAQQLEAKIKYRSYGASSSLSTPLVWRGPCCNGCNLAQSPTSLLSRLQAKYGFSESNLLVGILVNCPPGRPREILSKQKARSMRSAQGRGHWFFFSF